MGPEPPFDFPRIVRDLTSRGVRFVLFGGQAVRLYGSQRVTKDYDVWIESTAREQVLGYLEEELGFELSAGRDEPKPVVMAHAGPEKIDLWFVKVMRNREGTDIAFEDVYGRSRVARDDSASLSIHVLDLDDLIETKKMAPAMRSWDEQDIAFLQVRKAAEEAGEV